MKQITDWIIILIFPALILGFALWYNLSTYNQWKKIQHLNEHGIPQKAIVVDKNKVQPAKGTESYYLYYEYNLKPKHRLIKIMEEVDQSTFLRYSISNEIEIIYDIKNPDQPIIHKNQNIDKSIIISLIIDVLLLLGIAYFYFSSRK